MRSNHGHMGDNGVKEALVMDKIKDFLIGVICLVLLIFFFLVINGGFIGLLHNIATGFFFFLVLMVIVVVSWIWSKIKG